MSQFRTIVGGWPSSRFSAFDVGRSRLVAVPIRVVGSPNGGCGDSCHRVADTIITLSLGQDPNASGGCLRMFFIFSLTTHLNAHRSSVVAMCSKIRLSECYAHFFLTWFPSSSLEF